MKKKISINGSKNGRCLNSRELINDETDVELIIVNPDEEYEEIKKIITPSVKSKLSGKINLFSIEWKIKCRVMIENI